MSNIFKSHSGIFADKYVFPKAEALDVNGDEFVELSEDDIAMQNFDDTDGDDSFNESSANLNDMMFDDEIALMIAQAKQDSEQDYNVVDIENKKNEMAHKNAVESKMDFANVQASEIIEDAMKRAQIIIDEATEKAENLTQTAMNQVQNVQKKAFDKGYEEGFAQGSEQAAQESVLQLKEFLKAATQQTELLYINSQKELCDLAVSVAEKVIQVSLKSSKEVIGRMIQVATEKLKRREWVRIYINNEEAKGLVETSPALMAALGGLSDNIKIVPLKECESGTCIIEMPDEIIDASVSTQLKNIQDTLNHLS